MKIGALPMTPPAGAPPLTGAPADDTARQDRGFTELLAALLSDTVAREAAADAPLPFAPTASDPRLAAASAPAPQIGSHGEAFDDAQLLVEIALPFRGIAGGINVHHAPDTQPVGSAAHARRAEWAASLPSGLAELLGHWLTRFAPQGSNDATAHANPVHVSPLPRPAAIHGQPASGHTAPMSHSPDLPIGLEQIAEGPAAAEQSAGPATPSSAAKRASPFSAQLLALEGGLRLVLRLPRLAEGERDGLVTGLARLFESFGHHRHEIVIQETAKGQG